MKKQDRLDRTDWRITIMDDLETLKHAKKYIDKLANGINPITDQPVPETDTVNNVRITRCLFYVSSALQKMIDHSDTEKETKQRTAKGSKKKAFWLSVDDLNAFAFSDTPIPISEICKRLNDLKRDDGMKKLSRKRVVEWLMLTGLLETDTDEAGVVRKRPTEQGKNIGINSETRVGTRGNYTAVFYNREAQQFILDNFYSILQMDVHAE
jgi:hypothetical protein